MQFPEGGLGWSVGFHVDLEGSPILTEADIETIKEPS